MEKENENHSSKYGEKLTDYEKNFIMASARLCCPDCELGKLLEGPHGGMAINCFCDNRDCGSKFNLAVFKGKLILAERISDSFPKKKIIV